LAAGNPKYGRYDEYRPFSEQIDLSPPLLSRFDLIFPMKDRPNKDKDTKLSEHILSTHFAGQMQKHLKIAKHPNYTAKDCEKAFETIEPPFSTEFLRKYIAYSRLEISPVITGHVKKSISILFGFLCKSKGKFK
jgi:replicative DNA helicase Mcm